MHNLLFRELVLSHFSVYVYTHIYVYICIDMNATTPTDKTEKTKEIFERVLVYLLHDLYRRSVQMPVRHLF